MFTTAKVRGGLHTGKWDTSGIDIVSDITNIPLADCSQDYILCTEVLEHLSEPEKALNEMARLLKPGGELILTAPFASMTHFAPHFYCTGFSQYFYEYHGNRLNLEIIELEANGCFFDVFKSQLMLAAKFSVSRRGVLSLFTSIPIFCFSALLLCYLSLFKVKSHADLMCFGYFCKYRKL